MVHSLYDILVLGLNPAWQKVLSFEHFAYGEVNRAHTVREMASGKGINFARAAGIAGHRCAVAQFAGGDTGDALCAALNEWEMPHLTVRTAAVTRTCTTLLSRDDHAMTEVIEPSGEISCDEVQALREKIAAALSEVKAVALCGTFPPGVPPEFYAGVICTAKSHGKLTLLDSYRNVAPALHVGPFILKINRKELIELKSRCSLAEACTPPAARPPGNPNERVLAQAPTPGHGQSRRDWPYCRCSLAEACTAPAASTGDGTHSGRPPASTAPHTNDSRDGFPAYGHGQSRRDLPYLDAANGSESVRGEVLAAARGLLGKYPIGYVAVTAGADVAWLVGREDVCELAPPRLDNVVNPIGAGDCAAGVMVSRCVERMTEKGIDAPEGLGFADVRESFREGLAAASLSCKKIEPAVFDADEWRAGVHE